MPADEPTPPTPPTTPSAPPSAPAATAAPPTAPVPPLPPSAEPTGTTGGPAGASTAAGGGGGADWPAQAADTIVDAVGKVRDATTGRLLMLARGVVYGTAIVVLAITFLVLFIIGTVRALDAVLPGEVWSAYLVVGVVTTAAGLILWAKRGPQTP